MEPELQWLVSLPTLIGIGLIGMLMHFFKKHIKGETLTEIKDYFSDHFKSTAIAIVSTVIGVVVYYLTLGTGQAADILTTFGAGYVCDSLFNKWDGESQTITTRTEVEEVKSIKQSGDTTDITTKKE